MYTAQIRHRVIWSNGMGPDPQWGEPQVNPIDNTFDQIANSWKVRVNHDYVINPQLVNHVTRVGRPLHQPRPEQDRRPGLGQAARHRRHPRRRRLVPVDQLQRRHRRRRPTSAAPTTRTGAISAGASTQSLTWSAGKHTMKFGGEIGRNGVDRFFSGGRAGTFKFSNFTTSQPNSPSFGAWGNSFASFLLGDVSSTTAVIPVDTRLRLEPLCAVRPGRVARDAGPDPLVRTALGLPAAVP